MGNVAKVLLGGHVLLIMASSTVVAVEEVEKKRKEFKLAGLGGAVRRIAVLEEIVAQLYHSSGDDNPFSNGLESSCGKLAL